MIAVLAVLAVAYAHPEQLVDTDWVAAHAADANVRIVDMRQSGYPEGHVPGAVYVSPVAIRVADRPPTFLPTPQEFAVAQPNGLLRIAERGSSLNRVHDGNEPRFRL